MWHWQNWTADIEMWRWQRHWTRLCFVTILTVNLAYNTSRSVSWSYVQIGFMTSWFFFQFIWSKVKLLKLVFGFLDFRNLWKPINRIRIILGMLGCTHNQISNSCSYRKNKYFCNLFFGFATSHFAPPALSSYWILTLFNFHTSSFGPKTSPVNYPMQGPNWPSLV